MDCPDISITSELNSLIENQLGLVLSDLILCLNNHQ